MPEKYLETLSACACNDISLSERAISGWDNLDFESLKKSFPESYQTLPDYMFLEKDDNAWQSGPYRQSEYMLEKKIHTTSRGLKVRSKPELLIAEKFYEHGIPFRYEQLLDIGGIEYAPDFTVLCPDERLAYWEHCGMTGNPSYMQKHRRKLEAYERAGIVPWKNLIAAYDDENGILNLAVVESEIINKIKS